MTTLSHMQMKQCMLLLYFHGLLVPTSLFKSFFTSHSIRDPSVWAELQISTHNLPLPLSLFSLEVPLFPCLSACTRVDGFWSRFLCCDLWDSHMQSAPCFLRKIMDTEWVQPGIHSRRLHSLMQSMFYRIFTFFLRCERLKRSLNSEMFRILALM